MTETDLARDLHGVLERVLQGTEVIVEHENRPLARITAVAVAGRPIDECIALAKLYEERLGYAPVPDAEFAQDVQAGIDAHREPLNPPAWD